ncbi:arginine N-succinyltransferase [Desulfogranum marinum]|jgi:hypothetical protein|uniref:arginine N-succinyltransferase n=1 Tax=Desulfogranum marinum TaxID=453220 RepID=UPI0029C8BB8C|nr:arginine N-succinyltransferase [Desulfogranum marinum]
MEQQQQSKKFSGKQVAFIVFAAIAATIIITLFIIQSFLYPQPFTPVTLTPQEQEKLQEKLQQLDSPVTERPKENRNNMPVGKNERPEITPEAYTEDPASRTVIFNEKELNSLLANNTDLARQVAIDLAQDLVSIKMLIPVNPDFPILGGKTLKIRAGAELAYRQNRPVIILRGISLMGVPLPKAWLGGMKNIDLIEEFGTEAGFWQGFAEGVESLEVIEGNLKIVLKE